MSNRISRSTFLKLSIGGVGLVCAVPLLLTQYRLTKRKIPVRMLGPSVAVGHKLRDGHLPAIPKNVPETRNAVTIIGGGMAGLSAAWWLKKNGVTDFVVLELEKEPGGNSRSGSNEISKYPWGAHYVPLANPESEYVRALFEETGVITGIGAKGQPIYNELYLCHEPQERLLKDGYFQEGMVPHRGLQPKDNEQLARFFKQVAEFRAARGDDGKPAFAIPLDLSSQDDRYVALDRISFAGWLKANAFDSKPLLWYLNYCCRDDYGSTVDNVSAWAGFHYFAGRRGTASNAEMNAVVTWPEGNGFLVKKLQERVKTNIRTEAVVANLRQDDSEVTTTFINPLNGNWQSVKSKYVVFAAPRFIANHIIADEQAVAEKNSDTKNPAPEAVNHKFTPAYAPWLVANITLKQMPSARGTPVCWENVSYMSESLGYVVATHQDITTRDGATVITYYYPLSQSDPNSARHKLLESTADQWSKTIIADLESMHPDIEEQIVSIDLWPWGHGMVSPSKGFIWGEDRTRMQQNQGRIYFAHSDMSGMSNFEEAQFHGVTAAKRILEELKTA